MSVYNLYSFEGFELWLEKMLGEKKYFLLSPGNKKKKKN